MKKLLLATTMLVGTAGLASAEVTLSGDARMGIVHDATDATTFTSRARVSFGLSAESDNGLSFGASFGAHNASSAASGSAGSVSISGAFGKLSMGDVDSAFGATFGQIGGVGLTGLGDLNEVSHSSDGGKFSTGGWSARTGSAILEEDLEHDPLDGISYDNTGDSDTSSLYSDLFVWDPDYDGVDDGEYLSSVAKMDAFGADMEFQFGGAFSASEFHDYLSDTASYDWLINEDGARTYNESDFWEGMKAAFGVVDTNGDAEDNYDFVDAMLGATSSQDYLEDDYGFFIRTETDMAPIDAKVLYSYSADAVSGAIGYSQLGNNTAYSVAGAFSTGGLKVSLGVDRAEWKNALTTSLVAHGVWYTDPSDASDYEAADYNNDNLRDEVLLSHTLSADAKGTNLGVSYTMDALTVAAIYQHKDFDLGGRHMDEIVTTGLSATYAADAMSVTGFTRSADSSATGRNTAYGLGVGYDIGGGAAVKGGVVGGDTHTVYDLGLSFSF